jgi:hypothetical protein
MTFATRLLSTGALLVACATPAIAQRGTPDPERAAARQVLLELASDLQDGKWAQADSLFAPRGVHVLADTNAFHSWAEYRDKQVKPELAKLSGVKVVHSGVESQVRGNVAWVAFKQEVGGSSGQARVGRGSAVLEKVDGRWTIVHYHISR